jgi:nicotinate-nucleotide adenylyltransferase
LFFGSFNPIHNGHLIIANYMLQYTDITEAWLIVSPQNPFKTDTNLLNEKDRYDLVCIALEGNSKIKPSNIELNMEKPSFTINTIKKLKETNTDCNFVLIIGSDNQDDFDMWKDYEEILSLVEVFVYPRHGYSPKKFLNNPKIKTINAPMIELSSSFIRETIKLGKDPRYFLPEKVYEIIISEKLYT